MLKGNVIALLDEFKKAILELNEIILPLSEEAICTIRDDNTKDEDCKSIQTILSHVINAGYIYTQYYKTVVTQTEIKNEKFIYATAKEYETALLEMYHDCESFFLQNTNLPIEALTQEDKIKTRWGQAYDIEQLMEHSIVHVLRHRRQISKFLEF